MKTTTNEAAPETAAVYYIECRHASGSSHWDREPGDGPHDLASAETTLRWFQRHEPRDAEGAALEYRIVEDD